MTEQWEVFAILDNGDMTGRRVFGVHEEWERREYADHMARFGFCGDVQREHSYIPLHRLHKVVCRKVQL